MLATTIQSVKRFDAVSFVPNSFYNDSQGHLDYSLKTKYAVRWFTIYMFLSNLLFIVDFPSS